MDIDEISAIFVQKQMKYIECNTFSSVSNSLYSIKVLENLFHMSSESHTEHIYKCIFTLLNKNSYKMQFLSLHLYGKLFEEPWDSLNES